MGYLDTVAGMDVAALEREVITHNYHYWVRAQPQISDYDYDKLVELLRSNAPDSGVIKAVGMGGAINNPAYRERIADVVARYPIPADMEIGEKVAHDAPMLSLDKCYDEDTLRKWFAKFEGDAVVSPKIDGVALSLKYREGKLVLAATRGDGVQGEIVTDNARHIVGLPLELDASAIEVRGEAYMPNSIFEANFKDQFANTRNLTAGGLKQKDTERTAQYKIRFMAYDLQGERFETEVEKFERIKALGFETVAPALVKEGDLQKAYDAILAQRGDLDVELDGVVYRTNAIAEQQRMGLTAHHPRYAIAYKFQGDSGASVLRSVEWSISRTGAINPVACVEPVELSGAMVSRASLHNLAIMEALGHDGVLYLGSKVVMMRRGGVIPHVESVAEHGVFEVPIPATCPSCGAPTYRVRDVLMADHTEDCRVFQLKVLEHFVKVIKADGFGEKIIAQLYDAGQLRSVPDFFTLDPAQMETLERMGKRSAAKLVANIQAQRRMPAAVFLRALSIDELGKHVGKLLVETYGDLDKIRALEAEELASLHTIGDTIAQSVTEGLKARSEFIDTLLQHITLVWPGQQDDNRPVVTDSPLSGKKVLFTGAMASMTRGKAQELVLSLGGEAASGVNKALDFLVLGDKDMGRYKTGWRSSKLKKAEKLINDGTGLQLISESDFLEMVNTRQA